MPFPFLKVILYIFSQLFLYILGHPPPEKPRLLHHTDLRPQRTGGGPLLGQLLADRGRRPREDIPRSPHCPDHHYPEYFLLLQPTESVLYKGFGCLAGCVHAFCVRCIAGVCVCECDLSRYQQKEIYSRSSHVYSSK